MSTPSFLDYITPGPVPNPAFLDGTIGTNFLTPDQAWFRQRTNRRKFGEGDPDAGGYVMSRIHWNKEDGTLSYLTTDAGPAAWYGEDTGCDCPEKGDCGCQ